MTEERKENQSNEESLNVSEDTGWACCPVCEEIWRTWFFRYPFYIVWEHFGFPPKGDPNGHVPERRCPIHAKEIVVDGRAKARRTIVDQDQMKEMSQNGLYCPACKKGALRMFGNKPNSWICDECKALVVIEMVVSKYGELEIKSCSFRRDLGERKPDKLFSRQVEFLEKSTIRTEQM